MTRSYSTQPIDEWSGDASSCCGCRADGTRFTRGKNRQILCWRRLSSQKQASYWAEYAIKGTFSIPCHTLTAFTPSSLALCSQRFTKCNSIFSPRLASGFPSAAAVMSNCMDVRLIWRLTCRTWPWKGKQGKENKNALCLNPTEGLCSQERLGKMRIVLQMRSSPLCCDDPAAVQAHPRETGRDIWCH